MKLWPGVCQHCNNNYLLSLDLDEKNQEKKKKPNHCDHSMSCDQKVCISCTVLSAGGAVSVCGPHSQRRSLTSSILHAQV